MDIDRLFLTEPPTPSDRLVKRLKRIRQADKCHVVTVLKIHPKPCDPWFCHKNFYFTATPHNTINEDGWGMNNANRFGERIYYKTPKEMIKAGEMVPPKIHYIEAEEHKIIGDNNYEELFLCIKDAFERHKAVVKGKSVNPSLISPKLLVSVGGQDILDGILNCNALKGFENRNQNVSVLAISSDVGTYINGQRRINSNSAKEEFFEELSQLQNDEEAIIIYVNMLTEGIDVPGITGFMPLRSMSNDNLKQGIGRTCRLHGRDRDRFYNNQISPDNYSDYVKPDSWLIIPEVTLTSSDYRGRYRDIVRMMYDTYGFEHTCIFIDKICGINEWEGLEDQTELDKIKKLGKNMIEYYCHTFEEDIDRILEIDDLMFLKLMEINLDYANEVFEALNLPDPFNKYLQRYERRAYIRSVESILNEDNTSTTSRQETTCQETNENEEDEIHEDTFPCDREAE